MPYVQLSIGGFGVGKTTSVPLYNAVGDVNMIQSMSARIEATPAQRIADGLIARFAKTDSTWSKNAKEFLSTIHDVQEVNEQAQLNTTGSIVKISSRIFLGMLVLLTWLTLQSISQSRPNKRRAVGTAILMSIVAISSIALFFAVGEGLRLANEELGAELLSIASGAYMMFVSATIGAIAAIVVAVREDRQTTE